MRLVHPILKTHRWMDFCRFHNILMNLTRYINTYMWKYMRFCLGKKKRNKKIKRTKKSITENIEINILGLLHNS
jgi:hypothetical protein